MSTKTKTGKFFISQRATKDYQFILKTSEGELILMSAGFPEKTECIQCIDTVRRNAVAEDNYQIKATDALRNFFVLKSEKGNDLCRSQQYITEKYLQEGIQLVKMVAPEAEIVDYTM